MLPAVELYLCLLRRISAVGTEVLLPRTTVIKLHQGLCRFLKNTPSALFKRFQNTGANCGAVGGSGANLDAGLAQSICRLWSNLGVEVNNAAGN